MYCPNCGQERLCGCKNCVSRHPERVNEITEKYPGGDLVECGKCGFTMHIDWWQELDITVADFFHRRKAAS